MHTGSTFLGSILQQYPGTFYDYESLRSLQQDNVLGTSVVYMNGTERSVTFKGDGNRFSVNFVLWFFMKRGLL